MAVSRTTASQFPAAASEARREASSPEPPRFEGTVRLGRRTKRLVPRLGPRDIAVLDHEDIDRLAAEDLVASGVRCVVNVARSASGRYPNQGPLLLAEAGVHLVDMPGAPLFDTLKDGQHAVVEGGALRVDGRILWEGQAQDLAALAAAEEEGRRRIGQALTAFADNTMAHIREEGDLLAGRIELPDLRTSFRDRPALVVVRGADHQKDLRILRSYVRDVKPIQVAVDGAADTLLDSGFKPDMIVGDMDSASDRALRCGAELVLHAYPDGRAPGRDRLDALGLDYKLVPAAATSEDVAMLIAAEKGADLIVAVGSHFNLVEFLDRQRRGMSSTFLTRLRVGDILVDAKGVSRLYRPSAGRGPIAVVALAALVTLVVIVLASPYLKPLLALIWLKLQILLGLK